MSYDIIDGKVVHKQPEDKIIKIDVKRSTLEKEISDELVKVRTALGIAAKENLELKKSHLIDKIKSNDGYPTAWIEDIAEIDNMQDLETYSSSVRMMESEIARKKPREEGTTYDSPPKGSVVGAKNYGGSKTSKEEYNSYREMVDGLYVKQATGTKDEMAQAERDIRKLWDKASRGLKKELSSVSITSCVRCGAGIVEDSESCPSCSYMFSKNPLLEMWKGVK